MRWRSAGLEGDKAVQRLLEERDTSEIFNAVKPLLCCMREPALPRATLPQGTPLLIGGGASNRPSTVCMADRECPANAKPTTAVRIVANCLSTGAWSSTGKAVSRQIPVLNPSAVRTNPQRFACQINNLPQSTLGVFTDPAFSCSDQFLNSLQIYA